MERNKHAFPTYVERAAMYHSDSTTNRLRLRSGLVAFLHSCGITQTQTQFASHYRTQCGITELFTATLAVASTHALIPRRRRLMLPQSVYEELTTRRSQWRSQRGRGQGGPAVPPLQSPPLSAHSFCGNHCKILATPLDAHTLKYAHSFMLPFSQFKWAFPTQVHLRSQMNKNALILNAFENLLRTGLV